LGEGCLRRVSLSNPIGRRNATKRSLTIGAISVIERGWRITGDIVTMTEQQVLKEKLAALKVEHRDLDDVIARLSEHPPVDQLQIQRLKKRKLLLKDLIAKIESELLPDIIA